VTFTLKRDEVTGEWRKLHNEKLNDLYFSPTILRVIKSKRMRCSTYGGGERCVQGFGGKPEGKRPVGRPRRRWDDNIKWIIRKWNVGIWTGSSWLRIETGGGHL
jgi:hypothetical protein